MKILSVEPTPSPNTMKLNLDESLPAGVKENYSRDNYEEAPELIRKLFMIDGVKGVYRVADFIAIDRYPKADWQTILSKVSQVFGQDEPISESSIKSDEPKFGEVQVLVQMFKGIPTQVKLLHRNEESRFGLPERFAQAVMKVQKRSPNYIYERKWEDKGVRYGEIQEIGKQLVEEISAAYDVERLNTIVDQILQNGETVVQDDLSSEIVADLIDHPNWQKRFAALERLNPTKEDIPILAKALTDPQVSIRRLAVVYLGMIGGSEVLPYLFKALKDESVIVRRTAGDTLSDLGDPKAIGPMVEALKDPNKLVRWRAARFLYEVGDETAVPALKEAEEDPEFEIRLQIKMALERIESGEEASGTVWQQMTKAISDQNKY